MVTSPAGAIGPAQLMPGTARGLGVDPYNLQQNLLGGAKYLRSQFDRFKRWDLALSAYNSGPGGAESRGRVESFPETQNYVRSILGSLGRAPGAAGAPQPRPEPERRGYIPPPIPALPAIPGLPSRQAAQPAPGAPPRQQFALALIEASQRGQRDLSPEIGLLRSLRQAAQATREAVMPGPQTFPQSPGAEEPPRPAGTPSPKSMTAAQQMLSIITEAERRGLRVGENPYRDPVEPVHTKGSYHYRTFPGRYRGRRLGRGADISGDPRQQAALFDWIAKRYPGIEELIYDPKGSIFSGQRSRKAYGGHRTHVHVGL
jgi:Transglycosylase SLT domain